MSGAARSSGGLMLARIRNSSGAGRFGFHAGASDEPAEAVPLSTDGEWHAMTIAPTGAGKGVSCVVPALLQYEGTTIVIDPKGENAAITARRRREMGQTVVVVDPMQISGVKPSGLNPLDVIDPLAPDFADQARSLAQLMMPSVFADRDVFWRNRAMHLLTICIIFVLRTMPPGRRTMVAVRDALYDLAKGIPGRDTQPRQQPTSWIQRTSEPEIVRLRAILDIGAAETLGGMLITATEGVDFVRGEAMIRSFSRSDVDFWAITRGDPMTIYLVLPPHMLESHAPVLRLWLASIFQAISRRRHRPRRNTLLLLDEAAQLGTFAPLRQAITLLRGYGVSTWSFWQDVSQLHELYPRDWKAMANNCSMLQCFGSMSPAAALDMANFLGLGGSDAIERMTREQMMVLLAGRKPIVAERINYLEEPMFEGRFDPNPLYLDRRNPRPRQRKVAVRQREVRLPATPPSLADVTRAIAKLW